MGCDLPPPDGLRSPGQISIIMSAEMLKIKKFDKIQMSEKTVSGQNNRPARKMRNEEVLLLFGMWLWRPDPKKSDFVFLCLSPKIP